jgi:hypothetical protein
MDPTDKNFLKDGKISFEDHNKITIDGIEYATLSDITNADGNYISNLLSQMIDGYVDIAKGPWIMELGATPNVASTWLFLIKVGVPIDTVAYFMNQPIIRDYLLSIERAGYSYLFIDNFVRDTLMNYERGGMTEVNEMPSTTELFDMIGNTNLNPTQAGQQKFILMEFLKYAKMADNLYKITQGSNFDTANFNDPYLLYKKRKQLEKAQRTLIAGVNEKGEIVPAVNELLKHSFIGKLKNATGDIRNAFSTILKSDEPTKVRGVIEKILEPYIDLNDRDFVKLAQNVVSDLFDWAMQIDTRLNNKITAILIGDDKNKTAVAGEVMNFIKEVQKDESHPLYNNYVLQLFSTKLAQVEGKVNNLLLKNKDNQVYNQNQVIYAFEEIKANNPELYGKIVRLGVLQSGLRNSGVSFTFLLPYEDFKNVYNKTLSTIEQFSNLDDFYDLKVFERNNWNNSDIVPTIKAIWIKSKKNNKSYYNPGMSFIDKPIANAMFEGHLPQMLHLSPYGANANKDIIVYSWEDTISAKKKKAMRAQGDFSYMHKGLFQRVYQGFEPLINTYIDGQGQLREQYVYKMINAWGQGQNASEFYISPKASVINNGFEKVKQGVVDIQATNTIVIQKKLSGEVSDDTVVKIYSKDVTEQIISSDVKTSTANVNQPEGLPSIDRTDKTCG